MHELSVAAYLVDRVQAHADRIGVEQILAVNLIVGERACIEADALRFSFELLAPGTPGEGATINVRRTPMRCHCDPCAAEYQPAEGDLCCPRCGALGRVTDDGSELMIESLEVHR